MSLKTSRSLAVHGDCRPMFLMGYGRDILTANYIDSGIEFGILDGRYWEYDPRYLARRREAAQDRAMEAMDR